MKMRDLKKTQGISFVEVMIAVLIVAVSAVPIFYMVTSSRTDTSKAINYLRAVELANEVIEWAQAVKFDDLNVITFGGVSGTIDDDSTVPVLPGPVRVVPPENTNWLGVPFVATDLMYSKQYSNAFFYREIEFEDVISPDFNDGMMKKMTVRVKWNEGVAPTSLYSSDRDRQVELSVLMLNDANMNY
ncbi:MAG: hypothetical protein KKB51_12360 [Candidatus Riflebacteria bacterium]|nr:hypothetical protein [Candidatus Riflebacteria bacterium]